MKKILLIGSLLISVFALQAQDRNTATLRIQVIDNMGKVQEDAKVRLFLTEEDYKAETNVAHEMMTDKKGIAQFINMRPIVYYINVTKGDKNNFGNGEKTEKLVDDRLNKMKVVISD